MVAIAKQTIVELAHQLNGKLKALTADHGKGFADFHTIEVYHLIDLPWIKFIQLNYYSSLFKEAT